MFWNTGIFCARVDVVLQEYEQHALSMHQAVRAYVHGMGMYSDAPALSVDYAVLEKSNAMTLLPVTLAWSDVGTVESFMAAQKVIESVCVQRAEIP
jgi:mannose-1-phosphate guanylyltransferase